jgi:Putative lumazine-binding
VVAEAISSFQSDATSLNGTEICKELLAKPVLSRLESKGAKCSKSITTQLEEVDTYAMTVESISLTGDSATAKVTSTVDGKEKTGTISLSKEKGAWKISDLS